MYIFFTINNNFSLTFRQAPSLRLGLLVTDSEAVAYRRALKNHFGEEPAHKRVRKVRWAEGDADPQCGCNQDISCSRN